MLEKFDKMAKIPIKIVIDFLKNFENLSGVWGPPYKPAFSGPRSPPPPREKIPAGANDYLGKNRWK